MLTKIKAAIPSTVNLYVNACIPRWYDTLSVTRTGTGVVKPLSQFVQDIIDVVTIMDYQNTLANIISGAQDEIAYADSIGKKVVIALETGPEGPTVTFQGKDATFLETVITGIKT